MRDTYLAGNDPESDKVYEIEDGVAGQKPSQRGKLVTAMAKGETAVGKEAEQDADAEGDCHRGLAAHDPPRQQEVRGIKSSIEAEADENVAYELRADHVRHSNRTTASHPRGTRRATVDQQAALDSAPERSAQLPVVPHADDFVILVCRTRSQTVALLPEVATVLSTVGLRLSADKTLITRIDEGFDFPGCRIHRHQKRGANRHYVYNYPAKTALRSIKAKCKTICRMNVSLPLAVLLHQLNSLLRGTSAPECPPGHSSICA